METANRQPLVLVILDGWGQTPNQEGNAIFSVATPNFDQLLSYFPHAQLHASGQEVGLSWGEPGNSEVGHLNLGSGRIIMQDLPRIDKTIEDGTFFSNRELLEAYNLALKNKKNLHLIGLVSAGGVHSHLNHLLALLDLASRLKVNNVFVHMITDGRDTPPRVALNDLKTLENKFQSLGLGKVATVVGRYLAMDRDKHWDRIQKAYDCLTLSSWPQKAPSPAEAIQAAYNAGQTDEFIEPVLIEGTPRIQDGDPIIFFNYRADRSKQLSESLISPDFQGFNRQVVLRRSYFVSFTSYGHEPSPNVKIAFFAEKIQNPLAKVLSDNQLKQFHLAETEKYAHVTYFFNGGREEPFPGEERLLIPSPKVATYDLKPEMSAPEITRELTSRLPNYDFIVVNFANPDMVGHTGNLKATIKACEVVDLCLGKVVKEALANKFVVVITADHGNAEQMLNANTGEPDTGHTINPVPLVIVANDPNFQNPLRSSGDFRLSDVAPTILKIMNLPVPQEMIGKSLI